METAPQPAEWSAPASASGPSRDEVLRRVLENFMAEADDDMVYTALAELPLCR